jgi:tRNA G46 methylase TrmB
VQWHQNMLVQQWLPLLPQTSAKLRAGARVADGDCGTGQALIALARAFPSITAIGYDVDAQGHLRPGSPVPP